MEVVAEYLGPAGNLERREDLTIHWGKVLVIECHLKMVEDAPSAVDHQVVTSCFGISVYPSSPLPPQLRLHTHPRLPFSLISKGS